MRAHGCPRTHAELLRALQEDTAAAVRARPAPVQRRSPAGRLLFQRPCYGGLAHPHSLDPDRGSGAAWLSRSRHRASTRGAAQRTDRLCGHRRCAGAAAGGRQADARRSCGRRGARPPVRRPPRVLYGASTRGRRWPRPPAASACRRHGESRTHYAALAQARLGYVVTRLPRSFAHGHARTSWALSPADRPVREASGRLAASARRGRHTPPAILLGRLDAPARTDRAAKKNGPAPPAGTGCPALDAAGRRAAGAAARRRVHAGVGLAAARWRWRRWGAGWMGPTGRPPPGSAARRPTEVHVHGHDAAAREASGHRGVVLATCPGVPGQMPARYGPTNHSRPYTSGSSRTARTAQDQIGSWMSDRATADDPPG